MEWSLHLIARERSLLEAQLMACVARFDGELVR